MPRLFTNYTGWNSIQNRFLLFGVLIVLHMITGLVYQLNILQTTSNEDSPRRVVFPFQVFFHWFWTFSMVIAEALYSVWILAVLQCIYISLDITLGLYDVSTTQRVAMFAPSLGLLIIPDALLLWAAICALTFCYKPLGEAIRRQTVRMGPERRQGKAIAHVETPEGPASDAGPLAEAYHLQPSTSYGTVGRQAPKSANTSGQPTIDDLNDTDPDAVLASSSTASPPRPTASWSFRPLSRMRRDSSEWRPLLSSSSPPHRASTSANLNAHHTIADGDRFDVFLLCISIMSLIYFGLALFSTIRWRILGHLHLISRVYLFVFLAPLLSIIYAIVTTILLHKSHFHHALLQRRQTRLFSFLLGIFWVNSMWFDRYLLDGPPTLARLFIALIQLFLCFIYAGSALFPRKEWERAWVVVDENGTLVESADMHGGWSRLPSR